MPSLKLATFAVGGAAQGGALAAEAAAGLARDDETRLLQALALRAANADVVALQGVASAAALERFRTGLLRCAVGLDYRHALLIEGNDPAGGHVAVLGHLPIVHARSHRALSFAEVGRTPPAGELPGAAVFARDCLEVEVERQGRRLALFVCHFADGACCPGPLANGDAARERRLAEAWAVRAIIERRHADPAAAEWVVLGSLGDQPTDAQGLPEPNSGLVPLLADGFAVDLLAQGIPVPAERWTCHVAASDSYRQHDHLLVSPALARRNRTVRVQIVRGGLPYRAERHAGPRFPRVGWLAPAAGGHCPVAVELAFSGSARANG